MSLIRSANQFLILNQNVTVVTVVSNTQKMNLLSFTQPEIKNNLPNEVVLVCEDVHIVFISTVSTCHGEKQSETLSTTSKNIR